MTFGKTARRLAALALTIGAIWLCGVRASADSADYDDAETPRNVAREALNKNYSGKTVILHSNDVMGAVEGYPRMAWLKQEFERQGAETILADTGNFSMSAIYSDSTGAAAVELMNLTGYDVAALGRFEFSYGYDAMRRNLRRAAFPVLCANAMEDGENICAPNYTYTTKSGVTVGFSGFWRLKRREISTLCAPMTLRFVSAETLPNAYRSRLTRSVGPEASFPARMWSLV